MTPYYFTGAIAVIAFNAGLFLGNYCGPLPDGGRQRREIERLDKEVADLKQQLARRSGH